MLNMMPDNPFEIVSDGVKQILKHQGQDCFLAGVHIDTEPLGANVEDLMAYMKDHRNNFYRHWMIAYYLYGTNAGRANSPFKFANGQWDLSSYNDIGANSYFARLKKMLDAARRNGVIVQLTLFDKSGMLADSGGGKRWGDNPWNASADPTPNNINGVINQSDSGLPEFFTQATAGSLLASLQNNYVTKVVKETREFPNVVYEIMNEPVNASDHTLAVWANNILNVMAPLIQGRRLVFYNTHTGFGAGGTDLPARGKDVKDWKTNAATLTAYDRFDGVILHGNPRLYDPLQFDANGWNWAHDKLLQGSSDAFGGTRDDYNWNKQTTNQLFGKRQIFQAESTADTAANGIRDAKPNKPTIFNLPPFLGCWDKTSTVGPHFNLRFDGKGRFVAFEPVNDAVIQQGTLTAFDASTFTVLPDGQTTPLVYMYSLSADRQTLTYTRGTLTQVFVRMAFDYEPLLFGWQKFFESTPSALPNFLLYFGRNGSKLVATVRDAANPATIIDELTILEIHTEYSPPQLKIFSQLQNAATVNNYDFYLDAQRQPCMTLVNTANNRRQDFRRTI